MISKKIIPLFCFIASMLPIATGTVFAQTSDIISILQKIDAQKEEDKKVDLIINTLYGSPGFDSSASQIIALGQAMIKHA